MTSTFGDETGKFVGPLDLRERIVWLRLDSSQLKQSFAFVREVSELPGYADIVTFRDPGHFMIRGFGRGFPIAIERLAEMVGLTLTDVKVGIVEATIK